MKKGSKKLVTDNKDRLSETETKELINKINERLTAINPDYNPLKIPDNFNDEQFETEKGDVSISSLIAKIDDKIAKLDRDNG